MSEKVRILTGNNLELIKSLPDNSIDAVVTDPPYGLGKEPDALAVLRDWLDHGYHEISGKGFAGKEWDAFVPQPIFWKEVLRVLKPGGHLVSFAGTRTYDWVVMGLRLAGFEIRDQLAWIYGSGFPKNMDVARAIDAADAPGKQRARQLRFTAWMRETGLTPSAINKATNTAMGGHYLTDKEQPAVPTRELFERLRPLISLEVPAWVEEMIDERTAGSDNLKKRKPKAVRVQDATIMQNIGGESSPTWYIETSAHTDAAKAYEGWGTALKPAVEPIVLARKPFKGTVAENVLRNGTGAINIDGCRVPMDGEGWKESGEQTGSKPGSTYGAGLQISGRAGSHTAGRHPANLIHDGSDEVLAIFPDGDSGSAARFFYCPKVSKKDRDEGLEALGIRTKLSHDKYDVCQTCGGYLLQAENRPSRCKCENPVRGPREVTGNHHPTVKPTALMAWLCRLITPPGGTILDPFAGSGSTGKAAVLEGFDVVLMEREAEYLPLIKGRTDFALKCLADAEVSKPLSALQLALMLDNQEEEDAA